MVDRRLALIWGIAALVACAAPAAVAVEGRGSSPSAAGEARGSFELFPSPDPLYARIDALIRQLGSDRYIERSEAERELLAIGYEAFDQLKAAEADADPEIAARARYLTRQLTVDWTRDEDPPAVQQLLFNYDRLSDEERIRVVRQLAALDPEEALSALCLVARFDVSDAVSKRAALAVMDPVAQSTDLRDPVAAVRRAEAVIGALGQSRRTSAAWLRTYARELLNPADSADAWQAHVDEALAELGRNDHTFYRLIAIDLMQHVSDVYEELHREEKLLALYLEMVSLDETGAGGVLRRIVERLIRSRNWKAIDQVVEQFADRFRDEPIIMYLLAEARQQQGDAAEATELAAQAFKLSDNSFARNTIAAELDQRGLYGWAEREYREVLAKEPALSSEGLDAALRLSAMLYDIERYAPAADVAEDFLIRVEKEQEDDDAQGRFILDDALIQRYLKYLRTRTDYFRACHAHQQGDPISERKYLEQALAHDPRDIDVLIAMYRLPVDDVGFRSDVMRRIEEEAKALDAEIRQQPGYATNYNNWAWLIANTRGDYDKAVRYAHRAVEMAEPDSLPGFLDTLGRAYFARGDYDSAVRYQRRAVDLEPHTQQLRRQLAEFERVLQ